MKKIMILFCVIFIALTGCNEKKTNETASVSTSDTVAATVSVKADTTKVPCIGLDMGKYKNYSLEEVKEMVERYEQLSKKNENFDIQQVLMNGPFLTQLLCNVDEIKLIDAADDQENATVIIQLNIKGQLSYYNIRDLFSPSVMKGQSPLCPPPSPCDLPIYGPTNHKKY